MDPLQSTWRIIFGGVTLLDFSDLMLGEVEMPWDVQGASVARPNAAFQEQIAYGNATNTLSFSRVQVFATAEDARDALPQHNGLLPVQVHDAGITSLSGGEYTLLGARLLPCKPRIVDHRYLVCEYQLIGGAIDTSGFTDDVTDPGTTFLDDAP